MSFPRSMIRSSRETNEGGNKDQACRVCSSSSSSYIYLYYYSYHFYHGEQRSHSTRAYREVILRVPT